MGIVRVEETERWRFNLDIIVDWLKSFFSNMFRKTTQKIKIQNLYTCVCEQKTRQHWGRPHRSTSMLEKDEA